MFALAEDKFWEAVRQEDPELFKSIRPGIKSSSLTRFTPFSLNVA
jgi:hypothetical protein